MPVEREHDLQMGDRHGSRPGAMADAGEDAVVQTLQRQLHALLHGCARVIPVAEPQVFSFLDLAACVREVREAAGNRAVDRSVTVLVREEHAIAVGVGPVDGHDAPARVGRVVAVGIELAEWEDQADFHHARFVRDVRLDVDEVVWQVEAGRLSALIGGGEVDFLLAEPHQMVVADH